MKYTKPFYFFMILVLVACQKDDAVHFIGIRSFNSIDDVYMETYEASGFKNSENEIHFFVHTKDREIQPFSYLNNITKIKYNVLTNFVEEEKIGTSFPNKSIENKIFHLKKNCNIALASEIDGYSLILFDDMNPISQTGSISLKSIPVFNTNHAIKILAAAIQKDDSYAVLLYDLESQKLHSVNISSDFEFLYSVEPAPNRFNGQDDIVKVLTGDHSFYLLLNFGTGTNRSFKVEEYSFDGKSTRRYVHDKNNKVGLIMMKSDAGFSLLFRGYPDTATYAINFDQDFIKEGQIRPIPDRIFTDVNEEIFFGNSLEEVEHNFEHIVSNILHKENNYYFTIKVFDKTRISLNHEEMRFVKNKFLRANSKFDLTQSKITTFDTHAYNNFHSYTYLGFAGDHFVQISSPVRGGKQLNFIKLNRDGIIIE